MLFTLLILSFFFFIFIALKMYGFFFCYLILNITQMLNCQKQTFIFITPKLNAGYELVPQYNGSWLVSFSFLFCLRLVNKYTCKYINVYIYINRKMHFGAPYSRQRARNSLYEIKFFSAVQWRQTSKKVLGH